MQILHYIISMSVKNDWQKIQTEYIVKNASMAKLCKKYGISKTTIYKHCKDGGWTAKRKEYKEKIANKAIQKSQDEVAAYYAELNQICDDASIALAKRIRDMSINDPDMRSCDAANLSAALERIRGFLPPAPAEEEKEGGGVVFMPLRTDGE